MRRVRRSIEACALAALFCGTTVTAAAGRTHGEEPEPFCSADVETVNVAPASGDAGRITAKGTAALSLAAQRDAMRAWHAAFAEALGPLLAARQRLYQRMPHRLFASVRRDCEAVARAVEEAIERYPPAPARHVEVLARDLLVVYRESARHCATGAYFSFTVRERKVRQLVTDLYVALEAYGLAFPRAPGSAEALRRR